MAEQTVTLRITADAKGLVTGVEVANRGIRGLGIEGQRAGSQASGGIAQVRAEMERTGGAVQQLKGFLGDLASAFASFQAIKVAARLADEWSDLSSLVKVNIGATEDASAVMDRLSEVARGTYSSLSDTAQAFAQNATTLRALGKSTQEQLDYTSALNNALVVSGAKGQQFAQVQDALGKAMATGALRGIELNTVLGRASVVAQALADELGVSTLELRSMGEAGKITGDVIFNALTKRMTELEARAESMPATIGDAFTLLRNSVLQTVGVMDQQAKVSGTLAEALVVVADNMETIIKVSAGIAGTLVAAHAAAAVATLAHEIATKRAAAAALAEAEAQLANLRAKGAGIVSTAQLTAAENALAAAQIRAAEAGVARVGMLGKLGGGLLALAGGPIGVAVLALAGLAAGLEKITAPSEAARSTLAELRREIEAAEDAYKRMEERLAGTAREHEAALVGYRKTQDSLRQLQNDLEAARLAQDELIKSGKILAGGGLAYGVLELKAKRASDMISELAEAQDQAIRSALRYAGAVDEQAAAEGRNSSSVKDAVDAYLRAGVEYTTIEGILKSLGIEQAYWLSLVNQTPGALDSATSASNTYADSLREQLATVGLSQKQMILYKAGLAAVAAESPAAAAEIQQLALQVVAKMDAEEAASAATKRYTKASEDAKRLEEERAEAIRDHARALIELEGGLSDIAAAEADYKLAVMDAVEKANEQLKVGMERADVERQLSAAIVVASATLDKETAVIAKNAKAQAAARDVLGKIRKEYAEQAKALGMTARAQEVYRAGLEAVARAQAAYDGDATPEYLEQVKKEAEEAADRLFTLGTAFQAIENAKSPFQRMTEDIADLQAALERLPKPGEDGFMEGAAEATTAAIRILQKELDLMKQQGIANAIGGFKDMASAMTGLFQDGSKEAKRMQQVVAVAAVAEQAALLPVALANATNAILNQGKGDPYSAFARMAAMAAAVAPLVASIGGAIAAFGGGGSSGPNAAQRQESQGTGTVLGDASAKSESIARAVEITANATQQLVGINRGMLRALQSMQAGLSAAGGMMARGAGDVAFGGMGGGITLPSIMGDQFAGNLLGRALSNILGGKESLRDTGIRIVGGVLSDMIDEIMVQAYQTIHRSGGWFSSSRDYDRMAEASDDVSRQFQLILASMADTVRGAAEALGLDMDAVNRAIEAYRIEEIRISTMDLSAEEAQAELAAVFSSIFDGLAGAVVPFIGQFQKVGEGLGETLVRVATSVQVMQEATLQLGLALDETDPERMAQISVELMDLMGGIEDFIAGMTSFVSAFAPESHKFAVAQDALTRAFEQFGLTLPDSRDGMWDLMQSLDATTEAGREQIAMLLQLADVADSYYQMLEDREARAAAIDAALADNAWDQYLDGLTAGQRAIEETTKYYDDWRDSLIAAGATVEQLAQLEDQRATAMARVYEAEAVRLAQAEQDYVDFITGIWRETQNLSDYQSAMRDTDAWRTNAITQANEHAKAAGMAGASEQALALIERRASQLRAQALAQLREETQSLVDQLYGNTGISDAFTTGLSDASNAAADYWAQQRRAAETLQQYLDSMLLGDLSALTPEQQLAEAWNQLNAAVEGGDADQATRLADVYLRMLREMEASGDDYNQGFWQVRDLLEGMLDDIGDVPDAVADSAGSSDLITVAGAEQIAAQNRLDLAVQLAQHLADLSSAVGQTVYDLMESMGVDLRTLASDLGINLQTITGETVLALVNMSGLLGSNLLDLTSELGLQLTDLGGGIRELAEQTGINLDALTVESVGALGTLANRLGIDLADIATSVGADLGSLADAQSLLNQALKGEIDKLPGEQADALSRYLEAIETATTEADANDAINTMADYINQLAPDIQDKLAPYFADVFPVDALSDLDYLTQISSSNNRLLDAAVETNIFLARIASNLYAANVGADLPAYASGGWVNGPTTLLAGEAGRELILPNPVSEFFQRVGIPVNAGSSDNGAVVTELRGIRDRLDVLERTTRSGSERVAAAVTDGDREARQQRDTLARQGTMERSSRL